MFAYERGKFSIFDLIFLNSERKFICNNCWNMTNNQINKLVSGNWMGLYIHVTSNVKLISVSADANIVVLVRTGHVIMSKSQSFSSLNLKDYFSFTQSLLWIQCLSRVSISLLSRGSDPGCSHLAAPWELMAFSC